MFRHLKQQASTYRTVQAVTACVYLLVTLAVPLFHTCGPCETASSHYLDNPDCCCIAINTDAQFEASSKTIKGETLSHNNLCTACLYSITSKFTQAKVTTALINIAEFDSSRMPPPAGIAKQSEWLTSVSLRAPPVS